MIERPILRDVLPELCDEVVALLAADGEPLLAQDFPSLRFFGWCECTDDFCQSFRTAPKPNGPYGDGHRTICLSTKGMINIDVVHGAVMYVEVIDRPEVKASFRGGA